MADNTQELAILLRAQNLTQQAFDQARKDIEKLGQAAPKTNDALNLLKGGLGALGIAFTATAVVGFAKDILDTAGNVSDLSAALGISTDAVQDFKQSAEDSGATIDDVGRAIQKLNDEAASNHDGFVKLGLDIDKILQLSPEDRFREVAKALQDIKDPAERAARGHDLLGKSYDALAASIENGIGSMENSNKMSKETIDTLDNLGDSIGHLLTSAKNFGGNIIATAVNDFQHMVSETGKGIHALFEVLHLDTSALKADVSDLIDRFKILRDGVTNLPKAPSAPDLFKSTPSITPQRLTPDDIKGIENALNTERKALDEASKAADKHAESIRKLQDQIFGRNLIAAANDYAAALGKVANLTKVSDDEQRKMNVVIGQALDAYKRLGQTAPAALLEIYNRTVRMPEAVDGISESVRNLGHEVDITVPKVEELPRTFNGLDDVMMKILKSPWHQTALPTIGKQSKEVKVTIDDLAQSLSQLANVAGPTFGGIARDLATLVAASNAAAKGIREIQKGTQDLEGGSKAKGILELVAGISDVTAAAVAAGKAIAHLFSSIFDRNKGRDLVVDFAESLGGFDVLHQKLLELGEEGEALWIKLTQGVGRNNPEQAKAAIEEVTQALEKQKQKTDDVGEVTEEAALATIETATQASEALKTVGDQLETNKAQWSDWSTSVMADIQRVADKLGAIVIPSPAPPSALPGFAGGTHGAYLDFGAGTPVMLHGRERIVTASEGRQSGGWLGTTIVQLDGREVARASTRYQKSVLSPYGVR